jgi:hypothetical protein
MELKPVSKEDLFRSRANLPDGEPEKAKRPDLD